MKFTKREVKAVRHMIGCLAESLREDLHGTILHTGAFRFLKDNNGRSSVKLCKKLKIKDEEK
jgi:hypothetical protein